MVFEEGSSTSPSGSRYLGAGFRQEPDFRESGTTPTAVAAPEPAATTVTLTKRSAPPNLEFVFDDPAEGEPGRDRLLVHGLWELLLAIALAAVGFLLYRTSSQAFGGTALHGLLLNAAAIGLLGMAMGASLRSGAPNLAIGGVAVAAGLYFAANAGEGLVVPLLVVVGLAAAVGAVQGVVVVGLHVPGWAAGLGIALALLAWSSRQDTISFAGYDPTPHTYWWFSAVAVASVAAGLVGLAPSVRRGLGRFRPVADPADRRGGVAAGVAFATTVVSSVLAGVAGVLMVAVHRTAAPSDGLDLTVVALGVALLGGTSAYGRRGGVFGTVLATGVLVVTSQYVALAHPSWPSAALAAAAVGLGLVVTRLVEQYGRPAAAEPDDADADWVPGLSGGSSGNAARTAPAQTAVGGLWSSEDAWGNTDPR